MDIQKPKKRDLTRRRHINVDPKSSIAYIKKILQSEIEFRNHAMYKMSREACKAGLSETEIFQIFKDHPESFRNFQDMTDREIERTVASAFRRSNNAQVDMENKCQEVMQQGYLKS